MSRMFCNCHAFVGLGIGAWDTASVTNMSHTFCGCALFDADIGSWDTSSLTNLASTFSSCQSFNQDIGSWDTSLVKDMNATFSRCFVFRRDLTRWITSSVPVLPPNYVPYFNAMFNGADSMPPAFQPTFPHHPRLGNLHPLLKSETLKKWLGDSFENRPGAHF